MSGAQSWRGTLDFEGLQDLIDSHYRFQLLNAAVKLDLFTLLRKPANAFDIAQMLGLAPQPLVMLLTGCEALGLLVEEAGRYRSSEIAALALVPGAPFDQLPLVRFADEVTYLGASRLYEALLENRNAGAEFLKGEGDTLYARLDRNPAAAAAFEGMMGTVTRHVTQRLLREIDLSAGGDLLDVAGGGCELAIALVDRWADLNVTVMDLPRVVEEARDRLLTSGQGDRVTLAAGDVFSADLPGCDHLVIAHFLEIWSEERCRGLLRSAAQALRPEGRIYLINMVRDDSGRASFACTAASLYFHAIASGEGMVRRWQDYEDWLDGSGFVVERRAALTPMHGLIVAQRA